MKKNRIAALLVIFILQPPAFAGAQDISWRAGLRTFFDNVEFGGSEFKVPQTMSGIWFDPGFGLKISEEHKVGGGIGVLHEFGSSEPFSSFAPTAWYEFSGRKSRFMMGVFPRESILKDYPGIFFQDSVAYYRPNISGIYVKAGSDMNYLSLWLDWTGRQSMEVREAFFIGLNGRIQRGPFYLKNYGIMFHYAGTSDPADNEPLHDNSLFLASAGAVFSDFWKFDLFDLSAGWVAGIERSRADNTGWLGMHGLLAELTAEVKRAGFRNTMYLGDGLYAFYSDHSNELYWGDPVYRAGSYNRSDFYIRFFNTGQIDLKLTYSLHMTEGRVFHEQILRLVVNLNDIGCK